MISIEFIHLPSPKCKVFERKRYFSCTYIIPDSSYKVRIFKDFKPFTFALSRHYLGLFNTPSIYALTIEKHEAAKKAFNELKGKPIPKVAELTKKYGMLLDEKKKCYEEYKTVKKEMIEYNNAKQNVDRILGIAQEQGEQKKRQETEH